MSEFSGVFAQTESVSEEASRSTPPRPPAPSTKLENRRSQSPTLKDRALLLPPIHLVGWAIGSSILLAIGSIGPWATASVLGISASASGLRGWGWVSLLTAICGGIAIVDPQWLSDFRWVHPRRLRIWLALLLLSLLACVIKYVSLESSGLPGIINPGWGLHVALASTLVGIGTAYILRLQALQPPE